MADNPRDFNKWVKSVERRLNQAIRSGQSATAVNLARDVQNVRDQIGSIEVGTGRQPAAPVEIVVQTAIHTDSAGQKFGSVSATFPPVTMGMDAQPIDVDRYELWVRDEDATIGDPDGEVARPNLITNPPSELQVSSGERERFFNDLTLGQHFEAGDELEFTVSAITSTNYNLADGADMSRHRINFTGLPEQEGSEDIGQSDEEFNPSHLPTFQTGSDWQDISIRVTVPEGYTTLRPSIRTAHNGGWIMFDNIRVVNLSHEPPGAQRRGMELATTSASTSLQFDGVTPGRRYEVGVRAVAHGSPSPMSRLRSVTVERDTTPPPIPSPLSLSSSGATVTATWDSLAATGDEMPVDFSFTEMAYGPAPDQVSQVSASLTMLFTSYIFETPPIPDDENYDGTWYFRHRAVDTSGNRSAWSPLTQIVPKKLVDDASIRFELEEKQRQIDEAKDLMATGLSEVNDNLLPLQTLSQQNQDRLDTLDTDTLPGLESRLQGGIDGVNQSLIPLGELTDQNKSRLDTLNNTTLPGIEHSLEAVESDLSTAQGQLSTAQGQLNTLNNSTIPGVTSDLETAQGLLSTLDSTALRDQTGVIKANHMSANSVVANAILANAVTTAKIATGAVTANEIASLTITTNELAANSVTAGKILANAVTTAKIAADAVTANEIAANTIVAGNIATNAVQTRHLQANSVGADQVIANSIGTDHLQARSVQAHQLQVGSFDNLFNDQQFTSFRDFGSGTNSPWVRAGGNPENVWRWENEENVGASIVSTVAGVDSRMELYCGEVSPGDQMSFRIRVRKTSGADGFRIRARHRGEDRSSPLATTNLLVNSFSELPTDSIYEINWTVPSNTGIRELWIDIETASTSTGSARFADPYMRRRIESQLLVDGAVLADKIATNAIETRHLQTNSVGANQIIANSIGADHVQSRTLQTHHLQVGSFENLWDDPYADYFRDDGGSSPYWEFGENGSGNWITISNQGGMRRALRASADITSNSEIRYRPTGHEYGLEVQEGEEYLLEFYGWRSSVGQVRVRARYNPESGGTASGTVGPENHILASGWRNASLTFTVPSGMERMRIIFIREAGSGNCHYGRFRLRKRANSQLLVDGAVTARTIAAEAVNAEHITASNSLTAKVANFLTVESNMIASNAITADKISFGSLNGSLITGLQIQTHTNNRGVKMTSSGIRAFNSSGSETFNVNASNGSVTATGGTFTGGEFRTSSNWPSAGGAVVRADGAHGNIVAADTNGNTVARLGGSRNELRNLSVGEVSIDGQLRVGGNGEGGIVPDGNRTRFVGRTPSSSSSEDTVVYGRTPSARYDLGSGPNRFNLTYETPAGTGGRVPVCQVHRDANSIQRLPAPMIWNTYSRSASGFSIVVFGQSFDQSTTFWIYYVSYWGEPPNSPIVQN